MSKYSDYAFVVETPHGKTTFRCRAKTEAAALAARDRYVARLSSAGAYKPVSERLSTRGAAP